MKDSGRIVTVKLSQKAWEKVSAELDKDTTKKTKITHVVEKLILKNL